MKANNSGSLLAEMVLNEDKIQKLKFHLRETEV